MLPLALYGCPTETEAERVGLILMHDGVNPCPIRTLFARSPGIARSRLQAAKPALQTGMATGVAYGSCSASPLCPRVAHKGYATFDEIYTLRANDEATAHLAAEAAPQAIRVARFWALTAPKSTQDNFRLD